MIYAGLELREIKKRWLDGEGELFFEDEALFSSWDALYPTDTTTDSKQRRIRNYQYEQERKRRRNAFAQKHGLVQKDAWDTRFGKLVNPHHKAKRFDSGDGKYASPATKWFDHDELFWDKVNKRYVLTTQPYDVTLERFKLLEQYCQERELGLSISYVDAWHYPGYCPLIVIWGRPA